MGPRLKLVINYTIIISISLYFSLKYTSYDKDDIQFSVIDYKKITHKNENKHFLNENQKFINKMVLNNIIAIFTLSNILFFTTFCVDSINNIDLSWGLMIFYLLKFNYLSMIDIFKKIDHSFSKSIISNSSIFIVIIPVFLFSVKHIFFVLRAFKGFEKREVDFRYKEYSLNKGEYDINKKIKNWIAIYFNFHFMNCFIIGFIVFPIVECVVLMAFNFISTENLFTLKSYDNEINKRFLIFWLGFIFSIIAITIETISDEQLTKFRQRKAKSGGKEKSQIIFEGLWKVSRHPNYFGEILFYWTLIIINYALLGKLQIHNFLGSIVMTLVFLTYSIPVMEKYMHHKHLEEYEKYSKQVPAKLFPMIY